MPDSDVKKLYCFIEQNETDITAVKHYMIAIKSLLIDKGIITSEEINEKLKLLREMHLEEQNQ